MSDQMGPELAETAASADFLRDAIIDHIDEPTKSQHDRSKTVGGSEIDSCPRKVKDSKVNDRSWGGNGYTARGKGMESALCDVFARIERHYRIVKQQDLWFTQIGDRQETLVDHDYGASATPDGSCGSTARRTTSKSNPSTHALRQRTCPKHDTSHRCSTVWRYAGARATAIRWAGC